MFFFDSINKILTIFFSAHSFDMTNETRFFNTFFEKTTGFDCLKMFHKKIVQEKIKISKKKRIIKYGVY
ncbi:hypothetical protein A8G17_41400 [Escherichia coli]|nr:hypothetical protein A8G17_41400 [Escherichia coli]